MSMFRGFRARYGKHADRTRQRGATIPEYALLLSAVAVGSLGAITVIQDKSEEELLTRADCVAAIPGSDEAEVCGYQATTTTTTSPAVPPTSGPTVPTTTTTIVPATTTTIVPATTTTVVPATTTTVVGPTTTTRLTTTTTTAGRTSITMAGTTADENRSTYGTRCEDTQRDNWCAQPRFTATRVPAGPTPTGVTVNYRFSTDGGSNWTNRSCTSFVSGVCTGQQERIRDNRDNIRFQVTSVTATPAWNNVVPGELNLSQP